MSSKSKKTAAASKTGKSSKPAVGETVAAPAASKASAARDPWGARIGSATAPLNTAIVELASKAPAGLNAITVRAAEVATKLKIERRGAEHAHLNSLRLAGYVESPQRGMWRVTPAGAKLWRSKVSGVPLMEVVRARVAE